MSSVFSNKESTDRPYLSEHQSGLIQLEISEEREVKGDRVSGEIQNGSRTMRGWAILHRPQKHAGK